MKKAGLHHIRSKRSLNMLRMGAYHFLFNCIIGLGGLAYLLYHVYYRNEMGVYYGVGALALWLLSLFVFFVKGSALRCSLCMNPVWSSRKCQKHVKAKPALGVSYRLGIATSILIRGYYRCPYCGEPFCANKIKNDMK